MSTWRPISTAPKDRPIDLWTLIDGLLVNCVWSSREGTYTYQYGIPVPPSRISHWRESDKGPGQEEGEVRWMIEHRSGFLGSWAWKDQDVAIKDAKENFHGARVVRVRIVKEEE